MNKAFTFATGIALSSFLILGVNISYGQNQPAANKITISAPGVINFKALAEYRLAHPLPPEKPHVADPDAGRDEGERFKPGKVNPQEVHSFYFPKSKRMAPEIISPGASTVFDGVISNHSEIPPDVGGTVGDSFVVATTNQEFDIFTKTGTRVSTLDIRTFFSAAGLPSGGGFSDPHAVYDAVYHRFVVVIIYFVGNSGGENTFIAIAVTKTSDPTGDWYSYNFKPYSNTTTLFDYPQIGINNKWITITGNSFLNASTGDGAQIVALNRSELYAGSAGTASIFSDTQIMSISPAMTTDTTVSTEYMVADYAGTVGYMRLSSITGPVNSPVYASGDIVSVNQHWSEAPVGARQEGSANTILVNDTRVINAIFTNGSLWFSHSVFLPATNPVSTGADWWQVDPVKDSVIQFGRIYDTTGNIFYYYPSITVDDLGDVLVGYTISSPAMFASAGYSFHAAGDAPNSMEDNNTYKSGTASYFVDFGTGRNRWGDFSVSSLDPANGSFWTMEEYSTSPANTWATSIAQVATTPCGGIPNAGKIDAADTVCNGSTDLLRLTGSSTAIGLGYQWQQSPDGTGWINATGSGSTTSVFTSDPLTSTTHFRCIVNCIASGLADTTPQKVVRISTLDVSVSGAHEICKGNFDTLRASGANTYIWTPGNINGSTLIVKPSLTTKYTATGTSLLGCKDTASFTVNVAKVSVTTSKDTVCLTNDSATLTASGAETYVWHPGNETGSTIVVKPLVPTTYTAVGTDSLGCVDSASVTEQVSNCTTGVNPVSNTSGIRIFPASVRNNFTLEITGLAGKNCRLDIVNILGNNALTSAVNVSSDLYHQLIDVSRLSSGIYFVRISAANKNWNIKIIKQ